MIEGTGWVQSNKLFYTFDHLEYPEKEIYDGFNRALELDEFKSLKNNVKVFRVNFKPNINFGNFIGQAVTYNRIDKKDDCTYAICVSAEILTNMIPAYKDWVYRHELRHCSPKDSIAFRYHDISLRDLGNGNLIGFFWEDFKDIACCDWLMRAFRNVDRIEEYLI